MFMRTPKNSLFKRKSGQIIIARLNDKILPVDRGLLYEDPLDIFLKEQRIGKVTGGGTQLTSDKEIEYAEIEIMITGRMNILETTQSVIDKLEQLGAPKGSKLIYENQEICFGKREGMAVYFDKSNTTDKDSSQYDVDDIASSLANLIDTGIENQRYMELKNNKTLLCFYKDSFEDMRNSIAEYIDTCRFKQYIKIVQIA